MSYILDIFHKCRDSVDHLVYMHDDSKVLEPEMTKCYGEIRVNVEEDGSSRVSRKRRRTKFCGGVFTVADCNDRCVVLRLGLSCFSTLQFIGVAL